MESQREGVMSNHSDLDVLANLIKSAGHAAPRIETAKSELRSDAGLEPLHNPQTELMRVIVVWRYAVPTSRLDAFHALLDDKEPLIVADASGTAGVDYMGTYAELPGGRSHVTLWGYASQQTIDAFKMQLGNPANLSLLAALRDLVALIDQGTFETQRLVLGSTLKGAVAAQKQTDPILRLLADG
jgi:hypothetical protein